jgi:hypothetical protein
VKYLLSLHQNEKRYETIRPAEMQAEIDEYAAFTASLQKTGNLVAGEALQPTGTSTTVRIRGGKRSTTDGPFAVTEEQLGGFYLIEAKDREEAIAIASRIPTARFGCVEVRPIQEFSSKP